ncbi:MAG: M20/M25/M40 family metallo-hydrolase [Kiritimatiellae bacterium]|nr:M20/M25/M40 family metallo-hydrolase [Kiritimatiellia bacterium]
MELLERLINAYGVSGNEGNVRDIIVEAIEPLVDEVWVDPTGNVIGHKAGRKPDFLLAAHMDEIGLMVREIASSGLLLCAAVGGVNPLTMIGTRVTVHGALELIHGIVTTRQISCGEEPDEVPVVEDLVVDTGLSAEKLAKLGVTVGAFLEPRKEANWLTYGNTISGKALDNRLGCYCLVEVARRLRRVKQEVHYAFTVQEEVGMQSAKTMAFAISPNWAVVVDVSAANDLSPEAEKAVGTHLVLGKGPCLLHMEEGFIPNTKLVRAIDQLARKHGIAIQHEVSSFGTTDAANISTVRRGVPSANISVPIRNVHSTVEIANRKDMENAIRLISLLLRRPPTALRETVTVKRRKMVPHRAETVHGWRRISARKKPATPRRQAKPATGKKTASRGSRKRR